MMDKKRTLAIVGLGEAAIPIITKAHEMGLLTLGLGLSDSLGKNYVDVFEDISIFDIEGMLKVCLQHKVDAVIASSEISTEPTAYLADRLHLPGNDVKNGFFGRNKYLMRTKVESIKSVFQPNFYLYRPGVHVEYPVVVKSVDSCGKQGVTFVENPVELQKAVEYASSFSSDHTALVEEYIPEGREYSVECLASGKNVVVAQVTDKDSAGAPHFTESGHHQPAQITSGLRGRIEQAAKDVLNVLGIRCGMAHLELKVSDDKIFFIEVGARGGGSHIADILTCHSTDCDYIKSAIECCLGIYIPQPIHNTSYCGIYYHIQQNNHLDQLFLSSKNAGWVLENTISDYNYFPDAIVANDRSKGGYIIYSADHKIDMMDVKDELNNKLL